MYESKDLSHLGLVAGMCDELDIVSLINNLIPSESVDRKISTGDCIKALILNGLGFSERRLYLVSNFFSDKPIEHLLGKNIDADMLNDDRLGRCLDDLYDFGVSELFSVIAASTYQKLNLSSEPSFFHTDGTSFHVDGTKYNSEDENCIQITQGYSRDHRPDLNQVCLNMIVENSAGIPLYINPLSGNSSDKTSLINSIQQFCQSLQTTPSPRCWVADSALYSAENIATLSNTTWLTRVPETIAEVKQLKQSVSREDMLPFKNNKLAGYQYFVHKSNYGNVEQEWLLIFSPEMYFREEKTFRKKFLKNSFNESQKVKQLCKQLFGCEKDAQNAIDVFRKKCKSIQFSETKIISIEGYEGKGKPKKDAKKIIKGYQIEIHYTTEVSDYHKQKEELGYFVLASNEIENKLTPTQKLLGYKDQYKVEKGFRFLKDPAFHASTIFIKKPERIQALLMIMALSLLVYSALEFTLRKSLIEKNETLPNQAKKQVQNPTMKWVFILLKGIHCLYIEQQKKPILLNINDIHQNIFNCFPLTIRKYYLE